MAITPDMSAATTASEEPQAVSIARHRVFWSQVLALVGYAAMCTLCLALVAYLRCKRRGAMCGNERAAAQLILPAYEPLLWILAFFTGCYTLFYTTALRVGLYTTAFPKPDAEFLYAGRQFVFALVVLFLLQKSVSLPALVRCTALSLILAVYTIPVVWLIVHYQHPLNRTMLFWVQAVARALLLALYVYVFAQPPTRASKRSIRQYCVFVFVYHALSFVVGALSTSGVLPIVTAILACATLFWSSLCPLLVWRLLRADTEYWRGVGQRVCTGGDINLGASYAPTVRVQPIDDQVSSTGIHLLIEMHRKYVIDFAHLNLRKQIGVGSSSVVFFGILRASMPVAVKMYTPRKFTEHTVAEFSHEAALCASLRHPNIITFIGICVFPPRVCLVAEWCQGNLDEVMARQQQRASWRLGHRHATAILVGYMLDTARAIAYLHSFSPPFLHRDIKPSNFLVDDDNTAKLTDFGGSRRLPRTLLSCSTSAVYPNTTPLSFSPETGGSSTKADSAPEAISSPNACAMMTVTGTVHYMPPEMIRGRSGLAAYGQAADVFSLAVTLWDILYPQRSKYPEIRDNANHFIVLESVLAGSRPEFDADAHPKLRDLISWEWHADPSCRPSAQQMVAALESIQEETLSALTMELSDEVDRAVAASGGAEESTFQCSSSSSSSGAANEAGGSSAASSRMRTAPPGKSVSGQFIVERMEELFGIDAQSGEGIRLGNGLMDAGFLHHSSHSESFTVDEPATYFFDSDNIQFCQPVAILEECSTVQHDDEIWSGQDDKAEDDLDAGSDSGSSALSSWLLSSGHRSRTRPAGGLLSTLVRSFSLSGSMRSGSHTNSSENSETPCHCRQLGQRHEPNETDGWAALAPRRRLPQWRTRARHLQRRQQLRRRASLEPKRVNVDALDDPSGLSRRLLDPEHELFAITGEDDELDQVV